MSYGDALLDIANITVVTGHLRISHFIINMLLYNNQGKRYAVAKTKQMNIKMYSPRINSATTTWGNVRKVYAGSRNVFITRLAHCRVLLKRVKHRAG
jgi:hypothetical protein